MKQVSWIIVLAIICFLPEANANKIHRLIADSEITSKDVLKLEKYAADKPKQLSAHDRDGRTPLELLIETSRSLPNSPANNGHWPDFAAILLDNGADPNQLTIDQQPILMKACSSVKTSWIVSALIDAGADTSWVDSIGRTPLIILMEDAEGGEIRDGRSYVAGRYDDSNIDALVRSGVDINHSDHRGNTAIFWTAKYELIQQLLSLLAAGADWSIKNADGQNAYDVAQGFIAKDLLQKEVDWRAFEETRTEAAARTFAKHVYPYVKGSNSDYESEISDRRKQIGSVVKEYDRRQADSLRRSMILSALEISVSRSTDPQPTKVEYEFGLAGLTGPATLKPGRVLETVEVSSAQEFLIVNLRANIEDKIDLGTELYLTESGGTNLGYILRRAEWSSRETPAVSMTGGFNVDLMFIIDRGSLGSTSLQFLGEQFSITEYIGAD